MEFDGNYYPYPSRREVVYGRKGMVCTSQALAAQAGLDALKKGGNAIDAILATAIAMVVLEPTSNGLGSDAFAQVWFHGKLYGINGSGWSPKALTWKALHDKGYEEVPWRGWAPVMVPGAVAAWAALHERFGKLPFKDLFDAAISYAEEGYVVMPNVAMMFEAHAKTFESYQNEEAFSALFPLFYPDGKPKRAGEILRLPDVARSLKLIRDSHGQELYEGEIADAIDSWSKKTGGYIRKEDLAEYKPQWVDPLHVNYHGYDVWELPPNGHGMVVLMALNIAKGWDFSSMPAAEAVHRQIEAMKLAYIDGKHFIADPDYMSIDPQYFLSEEYASKRRSLIGDSALMPEPVKINDGGTVYLCAADGEGNMVSYIQSNFRGYGSGIVIPHYGVTLNDRGCNFYMDQKSDNCVGPRKRSYHTIIPGFLTKDGKAVGPFGVMGGFMQPQGQFQVLLNSIEDHLNPQAALDKPRWQWMGGKDIETESALGAPLIEALRVRGHEVTVRDTVIGAYGRGEIIWRNDKGILAGGTEPRADGVVAAW